MSKCTVQFKRRTQKVIRLKRQAVARTWKGLNENIETKNLATQNLE